MEISDFFSEREHGIIDALRPLAEQRMEVTDGVGNHSTVNVFRNVPAQSLIQLVSTSTMKQVRGLVDGRDIYFWDAHYATHEQVARAIGVVYHVENRIHVWLDAKGHARLDFLDRPMGDYPQSFAMKRLLSSPDIYFDARTHGYVSGPEMMQLIAA